MSDVLYEELIKQYEDLRQRYQVDIVGKMGREQFKEYNDIHLASSSCGIEGNSFSVDETRELREKGMGMIPTNKTLFEVFEILDHFEAFKYVRENLSHSFDEQLVKTVNKLVTLHTLPSRVEGAVPGEYTTVDMAAGDTLFGDHKQLVARMPKLVDFIKEKMEDEAVHPMITSALFHGNFIFLHPFRDGNGRTARLLSNFILLKANHPLLIIPKEARGEYISALKMVKKENTMEYLIDFFFRTAIQRMTLELQEKKKNTARLKGFIL